MRIGYVGNVYDTTFRKMEAYAKCNPQHHHVFFGVREFPSEKMQSDYFDSITLPNVEFKVYEGSSRCDVDHLLSLNDKYFKYALDFYDLDTSLINLSFKQNLHNEILKFTHQRDVCFSTPKNSNFNATDDVIVKPVNSSGSYDPTEYGYGSFKFEQLNKFNINMSNYIIQEKIPCDDVVLLYFISNGQELICADIAEQQFRLDDKNKPYIAYSESGLKDKQEYHQLRDDLISFLTFEDYNRIPACYSLQCIYHIDKYYLIDVNTRVGPSSTDVELLNITSAQLFNYLNFMIGLEDVASLNIPSSNGFVHFATNKNEVTTDRFVDLTKPRLQFHTSNKTSGVNRSDISIFAYSK